jgi:hypothetical protein
VATVGGLVLIKAEPFKILQNRLLDQGLDLGLKFVAMVFGSWIGKMDKRARNQRGRISIHAVFLFHETRRVDSRRIRAIHLTAAQINALAFMAQIRWRESWTQVISKGLDAIALGVDRDGGQTLHFFFINRRTTGGTVEAWQDRLAGATRQDSPRSLKADESTNRPSLRYLHLPSNFLKWFSGRLPRISRRFSVSLMQRSQNGSNQDSWQAVPRGGQADPSIRRRPRSGFPRAQADEEGEVR